MLKIIALITISICLFSCSKNHLVGDKFVTLSYSQTYCSDAWVTGSNDSLTRINVVNYLKSKNLDVYSLDIQLKNSPETCNACSCKTGKLIFVTIFDIESTKENFIKIGFK